MCIEVLTMSQLAFTYVGVVPMEDRCQFPPQPLNVGFKIAMVSYSVVRTRLAHSFEYYKRPIANRNVRRDPFRSQSAKKKNSRSALTTLIPKNRFLSSFQLPVIHTSRPIPTPTTIFPSRPTRNQSQDPNALPNPYTHQLWHSSRLSITRPVTGSSK